ncbi:MAG TPA: hypothetical protein PLL78_10210 [Fimbriimonadaceae bacterium]|nr:hypothetical protein [Fimbriimonadaceae bacterium]HRJ97050.1 hypothetical protein [Fimbriimonadaceae bacterium]
MLHRKEKAAHRKENLLHRKEKAVHWKEDLLHWKEKATHWREKLLHLKERLPPKDKRMTHRKETPVAFAPGGPPMACADLSALFAPGTRARPRTPHRRMHEKEGTPSASVLVC